MLIEELAAHRQEIESLRSDKSNIEQHYQRQLQEMKKTMVGDVQRMQGEMIWTEDDAWESELSRDEEADEADYGSRIGSRSERAESFFDEEDEEEDEESCADAHEDEA